MARDSSLININTKGVKNNGFDALVVGSGISGAGTWFKSIKFQKL